MTVSNDVNKAGPYVGDDLNETFSFTNIKVFDDDDLTVVFIGSDGTDAILTKDADYTVSRNVDQDASPGGSITYPIDVNADPLASDEYIIILREIDEKQESDITNLGGFYPNIIENMADRAMMVGQQNEERGLRSARFSRGATAAQIASMEIPAGTRSKYLTVGSTGLLEPALLTASGALSASIIGQLLWPITASETAAGVTPTNYGYPSGNIRRYGAIADSGVTDNAPPIQTAIDVAAIFGGTVYVPDGNGEYYGIDSVLYVKSNVTLMGDGYNSWIKNTQSNEDINDRILHCTTYGAPGTGGMTDETSYDVADFVANSSRTLTFLNAGDGSNFTIGDMVMVVDQRRYTVGANDYMTDTFCALVNSQTANNITLDRDIPINLTAAANNPEVYLLNTGTVTNTVLNQTSYMPQNITISDLRFETTQVFWQSGMGLGALDSLYTRLWLDTNTGLMGNLTNHCTYRDIWCQYGRVGLEMGYASGDNLFENVHLKRTSNTDEAAVASYALRENWDGGGRNIYRDCHIDDETLYSNGGVCALFAKVGTKWLGGSIKHQTAAGDIHNTVQISRGTSGEALADYCEISGATIYTARLHGIGVAADRAIITNNHIHSVTAGYHAISFTAESNDCICTGNMLGGPGETGTQYSIDDASYATNGHIIRNNQDPDNPILHSWHSTASIAAPADTVENTIYTKTIPADVIRTGDTYRWIVSCQPGGSNDTKTVRFYMNAQKVYEVVFTAAQGTTVTPVQITVDHLCYNNSPGAWQISGRMQGNDNNYSGNELSHAGGLIDSPGEPVAATIEFKVTYQLANASDSGAFRQGALLPIIERRLLEDGLQT